MNDRRTMGLGRKELHWIKLEWSDLIGWWKAYENYIQPKKSRLERGSDSDYWIWDRCIISERCLDKQEYQFLIKKSEEIPLMIARQTVNGWIELSITSNVTVGRRAPFRNDKAALGFFDFVIHNQPGTSEAAYVNMFEDIMGFPATGPLWSEYGLGFRRKITPEEYDIVRYCKGHGASPRPNDNFAQNSNIILKASFSDSSSFSDNSAPSDNVKFKFGASAFLRCGGNQEWLKGFSHEMVHGVGKVVTSYTPWLPITWEEVAEPFGVGRLPVCWGSKFWSMEDQVERFCIDSVEEFIEKRSSDPRFLTQETVDDYLEQLGIRYWSDDFYTGEAVVFYPWIDGVPPFGLEQFSIGLLNEGGR